MLRDDIIYVSLLLISIAFGPYYRKIDNISTRQWVGTLFGVLLVGIVSGPFLSHPLIVTLANALIVTKVSPRICHLVSFYFTFFYLFVIFRLGHYFGLPIPPTHTNLIQMMLTLKLCGLAFELNSAIHATKDDTEGANNAALKKVEFLDVFHYAFNYMGVLTGPYYRYRTYWDSMHRPFSKYADPWPLTFYKLKQTVVLVLCFLVMNKAYPGKYAVTEEFGERGFLYRFFYIYPTFATFCLRLFSGIILSECVCQMAGLGAYPKSSDTTPGQGPRNYKLAESLSTDEEGLKKEEYDFETVHNMNIWEVETCILVRVAMKMWNTCIQYWMATCIYKRFPFKGSRIIATLTLSALWHGFAAGYYFTICQIPFYLPMEDLYVKFYKQTEENSIARKACGFFLWYMKTSCMAYLGLPFQLLNFYEIIHFYKSVYFAGHILLAVVYVIGRLLKPYILIQTDNKIKDK